MRYLSSRLLPLTLVGALLSSVPPARAEGDAAPIEVDEANRLFREGREDFNAGRTKDALRKYRTAWRLRQTPDVAANMGQAELELGATDQAAMHFAFALARLLPSTSREQRVALEEALAAARRQVGELDLDLTPSAAQVTIDGEPLDPALLETGVFVMPGGHDVRVTAPGYEPAARFVAPTAGQVVVVELRLVPVGAAGPAREEGPVASSAPDGRSGRGRTIALVTGGVLSTVAFAVGGGALVRAGNKADDAEALRDEVFAVDGPGSCPEDASSGVCGDLRDAVDAEYRSRNLGVGALVAGGVLVATTVTAVLAWPSPRRDRGESAVRLEVRASDGAAGIGLRGRF